MSTSTVIGGTRSELKSAYERDGSCALPYRFDDASVELLRRRVADISGFYAYRRWCTRRTATSSAPSTAATSSTTCARRSCATRCSWKSPRR